ncbi:MAG TPA: patatin-like phospholipase family protein [Smithellaceae bacterium]|nr:patatin-like phospholipase family protein [Smithellaceae bacterium]
MAKAGNRRILTALSLQGGGALGAYEYGAVKALYEKRGKGFRPRVVAGVSIGAINAALLVGAKGDPLTALDRLWRERLCVSWPSLFDSSWTGLFPWSANNLIERNLSFLGNAGMYQLRPEFFFMPAFAWLHNSSLYDTSFLRETLLDFVDPEKLNRPEETRLIMTAVNVKTGQLSRFDNSRMKLTFDHIIASGSFPVTFPMTQIGEDFFWDGGVFMNMPVGEAVNALEQIEADNPDIEREVIVIELHRMQADLPKTIPEAAERFYNLIFSGKFSLDRKLYDRYDSFVDLMREIDRTIPADSPIRNHRGYKMMTRHRKIDRAMVIGEEGTGATGSGGDFSRSALNRRIEAGYRDAMAFFKRNPL